MAGKQGQMQTTDVPSVEEPEPTRPNPCLQGLPFFWFKVKRMEVAANPGGDQVPLALGKPQARVQIKLRSPMASLCLLTPFPALGGVTSAAEKHASPRTQVPIRPSQTLAAGCHRGTWQAAGH